MRTPPRSSACSSAPSRSRAVEAARTTGAARPSSPPSTRSPGRRRRSRATATASSTSRRPGAEPHDVELSPRDVEAIRDADLVVYAGRRVPAGRRGRGRRPRRAVARRPRRRARPARLARPGPVRRDRPRSATRSIARPQAAGCARAIEALDRDYESGLRVVRAPDARVRARGVRAPRGEVRAHARSLAGTSPEAEPGPRELERLVDEVARPG